MSHLLRTSRLFAWLFLTGLSLATIVASGFYLYLRPGLPPVEQLLDIKLQTPLRVYSADDKLIAEFGEKRRAPVTIEQIPTIQLHAFMAAEDARFYEHFGVDFKGLMRAAIELVSTGEIQSGGSTITMQVAKNYFLSRDRTFIRKFNEILLALQIERELDKNRIMELYLNKIYLGNRAYGIAAAAQVYYDKPVTELSLAEMAMLAGLPKAPSAYNPLANPERAQIRRDWILGRMRDLQYITNDAYELATNAPLTASFNAPSTEVDADHVAEMARAELVRRFGDAAYTDGYEVKLTVESEQQQEATRALRAGLEANGFTKEVLEEIDRILPDKVKDYGNALFDLYEELYIDSNDVYKTLNFHSLGKPPFYAGKVMREGNTIKEDTDALLGGVTGIRTTGYGSQKERVSNNNKINAVDVNLLFSRSLQESSHYVAYAEVHRVYNKILKNEEICFKFIECSQDYPILLVRNWI